MTRHTFRAAAAMLALAMVCSTAGAQGSAPVRVAPVPADTADPILKPIFDVIRSRGGQPLNMHRTLGNAPRIFKPYTDLAFALRGATVVERKYRELIILRVTHIFRGEYEFEAHTPMAISCGMTSKQVDAVKTWSDNRQLFDERQLAVLRYADRMTSDAGVDDETFGQLQRFFSPQEIVELTMTASFYVSATLVTRALAVTRETASGALSSYGTC